jgi:hypothetical protein
MPNLVVYEAKPPQVGGGKIVLSVAAGPKAEAHKEPLTKRLPIFTALLVWLHRFICGHINRRGNLTRIGTHFKCPK